MALDTEQFRKEFTLDEDDTNTIRDLIKNGVIIATTTEDGFTTILHYRKTLDIFITKKGVIVFHLDPKGKCTQRKKK